MTRTKATAPLALALILLLAAYLRLANVATNPAWYTDEGTHLAIVRSLLQGQVQYLAINQSWLLLSRLPLFEFLLAAAAAAGGVNMLTLRTVTGLLGVVSVAMLYLVARRSTRDTTLALLAALALAIYPSAVLYGRFGFSYNLLAPLVLLTLLGLVEYTASRSKRWLVVAALAIGLGTVTDLWMFVMLVPFVMIILSCNWRALLWSLPLALLPFGLYAGSMLLTMPQAFLFDLQFAFLRVNQLTLGQQLSLLWQNATTLGMQDVWLIAGTIGLICLTPRRLRWIALALFFLPLVLLGRTTPLFSLSFYYLIPLLPLIALGVTSLIRYGLGWLTRGRMPRLAFVAIGALIAAILLFSTVRLAGQVYAGFHTEIDEFLLDPIGAQAAAAFINQHTDSHDLVIASPTIAWMWPALTADMQMPIAYAGQATPHLPAQIPLQRWAFSPDVHHARYVIVDNLWHNWAVPNIPGVKELLKEIESWPTVLRWGDIVIYRNPED